MWGCKSLEESAPHTHLPRIWKWRGASAASCLDEVRPRGHANGCSCLSSTERAPIFSMPVFAFTPHHQDAQSYSVKSYPTLCNFMDCSMPGFPVHHQLPELTQTHVHRGIDATQPSHPLWSPSPPTFSLSQHQSLFKWVSSLHQVAKVLEFQLQLNIQWIFRTDFLYNWLVGSPCSPRDSLRVFSNTTVQKHQCFGSQLSL